ncbi:glucose 1-dehydrogenase [Pseudomonas segetis]|uniref:NAD(P)-dependent dehydrogenase, short-chain alcohol dehydrogenase family n=1 Tax=Pseudomonas segetis TaxID=298908 RepID=A0A239JEG7_9PSED|nr:glucose 1-dehydrogenase [Pseudomonas segetis]SNT03828.1 NAD(P)-dependent dehydrogenase, short-chain alcohol dehydrogenase family [Pseudomonas segetis]
MRLQNKIVLVTGAASGMGLAFTRRLAAEGAKVYFTDINAEAGKCAEVELREQGLDVIFDRHDVTSEEDWSRVLGVIHDKERRLDVLVNNAGMVIPGSIEECTLSDFDRTMDVNLRSVFIGCKQSLPLMKDNGGSIINMSSITAICGEPAALSYSTSKAGVRFLSKSVALHCAAKGYPIRVNSLHPGYIETPLVADATQAIGEEAGREFHARLMQEIPFKRLGKPDEVAGAVVFLASDDSVYVTGTEMVVDGGYACH